ncbi:Uncharacterized protein Adt_47738 [Abeliophyllum distichum]|uniref:Uncharacterized protein n=1 Tax=Abeliophyllum distichum TaxID=126358 RepID=A0ABD1NTN3_9LAMI
MAESVVNNVADIGEEEELNIENKGNSAMDTDTDPDTFVLAELNLIMVLSSLSVSLGECPNLEKKSVENHKEKHNLTNLRTRRSEINECRGVERQISRVHNKIRDCRHCRRM